MIARPSGTIISRKITTLSLSSSSSSTTTSSSLLSFSSRSFPGIIAVSRAASSVPNIVINNRRSSHASSSTNDSAAMTAAVSLCDVVSQTPTSPQPQQFRKDCYGRPQRSLKRETADDHGPIWQYLCASSIINGRSTSISNSNRMTTTTTTGGHHSRSFSSSTSRRSDDDTFGSNADNDDTKKSSNTNMKMMTNNVNNDYFALFGLPRKFGLSLTLLKERYRDLMTQLHPDKKNHNIGFIQQPATKTTTTSSSSVDADHNNNNSNNNGINNVIITATDITNAYQTLQKPHTRATHILELYGSPLLEQDRGGTRTAATTSSYADGGGDDDGPNSNGDNQQQDAQHLVGMDFLMDMMERREQVEDIAKKTVSSEQDRLERNRALHVLWKQTQALQAECESRLERVLDHDVVVVVDTDDDGNRSGGDHGATTVLEEPALREARTLTAQLQYWNRLETTLRETMDVRE